MSKDPADTSYSHLGLEDLIAGATGQPASDAARAHLAECDRCRLEARRWTLVADGVRSLTAAGPERAPSPRPRHLVPSAWRRAALVAASAAAALVLLIGIGAVAGIVHVHFGAPGRQPALTAVTGCDQLRQADGTLRQVTGSSLIVKTGGGSAVTVTTTPSTMIAMSGPLLSDITDGATVQVRGSEAGRTIQAAIVTVGQPFAAVRPPGSAPVQGTVTDAGSAGFTLVTSGGSRFAVTTSADTLVVVPVARLNELHAGTSIFALGQAGPGGTLSARAVAAVSQLRSGPQTHVSMSVRDCSPASIAAALSAISTTGGEGGA